MKIVNIIGGLGNQMFQYAFALALQEKYPGEQIKIDLSAFTGYPLHNGYELDRIFNAALPKASFKEQLSLFYPLRNYRLWQIGKRCLPRRRTTVYERADKNFDSVNLDRQGSAYFLGSWQTEKYFSDIRRKILEAFSFPPLDPIDRNTAIIKYLDIRSAVSVHVRRGDYIKIPSTHGICSLSYYKSAIERVERGGNPDLYLVFSDDINWCREHLSHMMQDKEIIYVDWNKGKESFRDLQLMSKCKHNIIANSSFSWWGAWLNENSDKIVIAPSRWMNNDGWRDIIPDSWHKVNV